MNWALTLLGVWVAFCLLTIAWLWVGYWRGRHHNPLRMVYDHRCNGRPYSVGDVAHDCQASLAASRERRGQ